MKKSAFEMITLREYRKRKLIERDTRFIELKAHKESDPTEHVQKTVFLNPYITNPTMVMLFGQVHLIVLPFDFDGDLNKKRIAGFIKPYINEIFGTDWSEVHACQDIESDFSVIVRRNEFNL